MISEVRTPVDAPAPGNGSAPAGNRSAPAPVLPDTAGLTARERSLLDDLMAVIQQFEADLATHGSVPTVAIDRDEVTRAFVFACRHHADQKRKSGDEFITHPVGVARICVGMALDTETLCAALLHDTVEDTSASLEEIEQDFSPTVARLVDGVTKLT